MKANEKRKLLFPNWNTFDGGLIYCIDSVLSAYSDSNDLEEDRNLGFMAPCSVNGYMAIEIAAKCIVSYNEFNADQVKEVVKMFGYDSAYFFAREGSPAIYIRPSKNMWLQFDKELPFLVDEVSFDAKMQMFRLWWD